jgi:hypothetical protein
MKKITWLFAFLLLTFFSHAQKTIIHCGNLIDGKSNEAQPQMSIVVEGNKINSVQKGFTKTTGDDKLIDLSSN